MIWQRRYRRAIGAFCLAELCLLAAGQVRAEDSALRIAGLALTPPPGWTRADESGAIIFKPADAPCRFIVIPEKDYEGEAKEGHRAVLTTLLAEQKVVGELTEGTRHGFQWSSGQARDGKGELTWFTFYTITGGGHLDSILFDCDSQEAFERYRSQVERTIDGAVLQGESARKGAPLKPPCDRVGDFEIVRPAEWRRAQPAPDAAVYNLRDLPAGSVCTVTVYPADSAPGTPAEFTEGVWRAITRASTVLEDSSSVELGPFLERQSRLKGPDGREFFLALYTRKEGNHSRAATFFASSPELYRENLPVVRRMLVPPPDVPIRACYFGAGLQLGFEVAGGSQQRARMKLLVLYQNGLCLRIDATSTGIDTTHQAYGLASIDAETLRQTRERYRWVGWWKDADGGIQVEWANGEKGETLRRNGDSLKGAWSWDRLAPIDGVRLEGNFAYQAVGAVWSLQLRKDGRFEADGVGNVVGGSIISPDFPEKGGGTYELRKWSIILRYDAGYTATIALMPPMDLAKDPRELFLNEYQFQRQ